MEKCLEGYHENFVNLYLDALLNFSAPFDEHLNHQKLVFKRLWKNDTRIKARKCQFFKRDVMYLRRVITAERYRNDLKHVESIQA